MNPILLPSTTLGDAAEESRTGRAGSRLNRCCGALPGVDAAKLCSTSSPRTRGSRKVGLDTFSWIPAFAEMTDFGNSKAFATLSSAGMAGFGSLRTVATPSFLAVLLVTCVATPATARKKTIDCKNPDTEVVEKVSGPRLKRRIMALPKALKRRQVHVLDLTTDAREGRRKIDTDLKQGLPETQWCAVHLAVGFIEQDLAISELTPVFVSEKFQRVERWLRANPPRQEQAGTLTERHLANAAAKLSERNHLAANKLLNKALQALFGVKGYWDVPSEPIIESIGKGASRAEISPYEVKAGCPTMARRGSGSDADLRDVMRKLTKAMNSRKIRSEDYKRGKALLDSLHSYRKLHAVWPAIRAACAMLGEVKAVEIDLGLVSGRFHRVTSLRRKQTLAEQDEKKFRELVRAATDALGARSFEEAHGLLESLLVLMGEAPSPGDTLSAP